MREGMVLSRWKAIGVFIWLSVTFAIGLYLLLGQLLSQAFLQTDISLTTALQSAAGAALTTNALFYVRRLYKDIFEQGLRTSGDANNSKELATFIYFLSRPFFALLFSVLVVVSAVTFIQSTTLGSVKLSPGFALFTSLLAAYGAAATGNVITHLEKLANEKLTKFGG